MIFFLSLSLILANFLCFVVVWYIPTKPMAASLTINTQTAAEEDAENGGGKNKANQSTVQKTVAAVAKPVSSNSFASGSNPNGPQTMTGRLTSRVTQPPGGHTSWSLG